MKHHNYSIDIKWTGNKGNGTANYQSYSRDHTIKAIDKYGLINGSSDPSFLGDKTRYNPEELFLSSLSSCHMLCYLHLCTMHNINVTDYTDHATGVMKEEKNGSGKFIKVTLQPTVVIKDITKKQKAIELHEEANELCFIANSCNFKVEHKPTIIT